jgi:uncharacterized membrane protein YoaK (UPF0700 family)
MRDKSRALRSPEFPLAVALAAIAGWVDATAFVRFAHTFVSFMGGNSTKLAGSLSAVHAPPILLMVLAIAGFVAGAIAGESLALAAGQRGRTAALLGESLFLFAAAGATLAFGNSVVPVPLLAFALGMQNASVHDVGGVSISITYVTGALVHFGREVASALRGQASWASPLPYLFLWTGLIVGAAGGAALARINATLAIAIAALAAFLLGVFVAVARSFPLRARAG